MPDRRKQCVTGHADHAGMVRKNPQNPPVSALIGDSAVTAGGHLTAFLRAEHAGEMMVTDVGETDFAVIVYREEDQWEADVLPTAVTADLGGLVQALRRQPSIGGTIGFAGVGDDFFVAIMVFGEDVSLFLSDLTAAVDYPLARQVLDALEIPVPSDDELDQVLPAGDLSIFADLGLDEMELGAISADLDLYPEDAVIRIAERLRFGDAVERALDIALGP
jgi:putative tRNA adenosine deaminase-associated protein